MNKQHQPLSGISCSVSNCIHYTQGKCEANHINVQGTSAGERTPVSSKQETRCDTFSGK
ncbi:MAG: DUF1540 domain-containing protein [Oscillospiraceae bacterium]|jgi:hypothetical protein|nr:DUF1540 domain-containing protein [Oscillospiraceae bacterium]